MRLPKSFFILFVTLLAFGCLHATKQAKGSGEELPKPATAIEVEENNAMEDEEILEVNNNNQMENVEDDDSESLQVPPALVRQNAWSEKWEVPRRQFIQNQNKKDGNKLEDSEEENEEVADLRESDHSDNEDGFGGAGVASRLVV